MSDAVASPPKASRLRRWTKRTAMGAAVAVALGVLGSRAIDWYCEAVPPTLSETPAILGANVVERDGYRRIGNSYLARRDGILRMYVEGDPFTLGYCNAALSAPYLAAQEQELITTVRRFIPSDTAFWLIRKFVILRNRNLPSFVPYEYRVEIYGLSRGYDDPMPEIGHLYHRILNYHAAHDIAQGLLDNPLVGCTSFAAWGEVTENGHLLIGRNFDFDAGESFDVNKLVLRVKPQEGLGFLSVAWPGMVGAVTAVNDARIAVAIHAARSQHDKTIGTPVSIVLRDVMQHAASLAEAIDIIRASRVFVSDSFLLADGKTNEVVVVEKTPFATAVRRPVDSHIVCANHFLTPELKDDPKNKAYLVEGTSGPRMTRMDELVRAASGRIDPKAAAGILRDTRLPGGAEAGLGNAAAINPLIATHAAVIDVTEGVMWVPASPHQLGAFVPFALDTFEDPPGKERIEADPMLTDGRYEDYLQSEKLLAKAEELIAKEQWEQAAGAAASAAELNPGYYRAPLLQARIALARGKLMEAQAYLDAAAGAHPPYKSEREEIETMRREAAGKAGR